MDIETEADFIRRETIDAWTWFETILETVTADAANWWPPGTANSIGSNYVHVLVNADVEVRRLVYGRDALIEIEFGGDAGTGVPYDPDNFDQTWERGITVNWERLRDYGKAVHADIINSAERLTVDDLARPVDMRRAGMGWWTGSDMWRLHGYIHIREHGAEIACLKGLQGAVGYVPHPPRPE